MSVHLLKTARVAAVPNTPPQQHTGTTRLLARWCELTALTAASAAHHPGEEYEFFRMQQQVEAVLRGRSPKLAQVLDDLIVWEASLIHKSDLPASHCIVCRRASIDAKRLPFQIGGAL